MKTYKVKVPFILEFDNVSIFFNQGTKWKYIGNQNGYNRLCRENVHVNVCNETLRNNFKEVEHENT